MSITLWKIRGALWLLLLERVSTPDRREWSTFKQALAYFDELRDYAFTMSPREAYLHDMSGAL